MLRRVALSALGALLLLLGLTGCNPFAGTDDAARGAKAADAARRAAKAARDAKPILDDVDNGSSLADDLDNLGSGADDAERAASAESLRRFALKTVADGLLDIPEPTGPASTQRDALTDAVKEAACDFLEQAITGGAPPAASAFYGPLNEKLADYGSPAQNQADDIEASFANLTNLINGETDARAAAEDIACAFLPG